MTKVIASAPSNEVSLIESASYTINDFAKPTNQFNWSDNYIKLLAKYNANPFEHALALKPDETSADSNTPILATDITDKPLTVMQEKWLALINNALLETDDCFAETIQSDVEDWNDLYKQCKEEEEARYDEGGLNYKRAYLSAYDFKKTLPYQLFPRLSVSKQISLFAVQRRFSSLLGISTHYQSILRYIQAFIHQLKTDDPCAYQDLYQRHKKSHPEIMPIFFCADIPYPKESMNSSLLIHGWSSDEGDCAMRALFLHLTDSSQTQIFTQAYHAAIGSPDYRVIDILPPLLRFIDSCEQANAPDLIIDLLDKHQLKQEKNSHLFGVLADFEHELYLDWLVEHYHYLEVSKPLSLWTKRSPILTISKLIKRLDTDYETRVSSPDFSTMTKREISDNYSIEKKKFDILEVNTDYLIQLLTHLLADLKRADPAQFARLQSVIAMQNFIHYDSIIAPILLRASRVEVVEKDTAIEVLSTENLTKVSKWLITPPWQDEQYHLQAPRLPEHIIIDLLPKPIFKADGSELPLPLFENLIGILYESDLKEWLKPLTDEDILSLLTPFTRDSLNALGRALWNLKIGQPWGWLMNEDAIPYIHTYIYDHKKIYDDQEREIHETSCTLLILMVAANVKLWYSNDDSYKGVGISADVYSALAELFYQVDQGKSIFRSFAEQGCSDISVMTGYALHELRHLVVPTLGFNDKSEQTFHLDATGDNWLTVRLDTQLSPLLFDQTGTPLKSFPRAKKGDDKDRFKQVNKDIKALPRPLATLYKRLNAEFSDDLKNGVEHSVRFILNELLRHPILKLYGQTLFWSLAKSKQSNRKKRNVTDTFIMTEDQVLMNVHYEAYSDEHIQQWCDEGYIVVLTHPNYLSAADYESACEMLIDYGIAQPIEQMSLTRSSQ